MRLTAAAVALMVLSSPAAAADFAIIDGPDGRPAARIWGDMAVDDAAKFAVFVRSHPQVFSLVLSGEGGAMMPAIKIGAFARDVHLWTIAAAGQDCASACAYIWAAGVKREIEPGAKLGFHGVFTMVNGTPKPSSDGNAVLGSYLGRMGFSDGTIAYMTAKPPTEMQWLNAADAKRFGLDYDVVAPPAPKATSLMPTE